MLLTGHQPEYLPYTGLLFKAMSADVFMLVDHVQYGKKQFQNRNRIRTGHGSDGWSWLTVPVITHDKFEQKIRDVKINNELNWREKHLKSIQLSYKGAPFFNDYMPVFEKIYSQNWEMLADLNAALTTAIFKILDIRTKIVKSSDYNISGHKTDMLIDMCQKTGADGYLSGQGGKLYVDESKFKEANLSHDYCEFHHPVYKQKFKPFIPNMSAIDIIFNCGPDSKKNILESNPTHNLR